MADENTPQDQEQPQDAVSTEASDQASDSSGQVKANNLKDGTGNRNFTLAIVSAVVVALVLIGLGFAAFNDELSDGDEPTTETTQVDNTAQESNDLETEAPVTDEALQSQLEQLDSELNSLDDESDFDDSQLSDDALDI